MGTAAEDAPSLEGVTAGISWQGPGPQSWRPSCFHRFLPMLMDLSVQGKLPEAVTARVLAKAWLRGTLWHSAGCLLSMGFGE